MTAPARPARSTTTVRRQQRSAGRTASVRAALAHHGVPAGQIHTARRRDGRTVTTVWSATRDHWPAALVEALHEIAAARRWIDDVFVATVPTPHVRLIGARAHAAVRTVHPIGDLL